MLGMFERVFTCMHDTHRDEEETNYGINHKKTNEAFAIHSQGFALGITL